MSQYNNKRHSLQPQPESPTFSLTEEREEEDAEQNINNWSMSPMPTNKRSSLYSMNNSSNQSLNIPKRQQQHHHRRQSSMAAETYTPQQVSPLPPQSQPTSATNSTTPFKFGSMNVSSESLNVPKASYRRGHRYKHSSVSMNLFQEAPDAIVKNVPKTYNVPTFDDIKESINGDQKFKIGVCLVQLIVLISTYILGIQIGGGCLITLSHVLFYDFISNGLIVIVQIMANFPIWKMSSLTYPFGLGRIEVLCSFGLSVSLLFVGLDLLSHIIEEVVMEVISIDESGGLEKHVHSHGEKSVIGINIFIYEIIILSIIGVSLFTSHTVNVLESNTAFKQQDEISAVKRLSSITLNAPFHKPKHVRILNFLGFSIDDSNGKRNIMSSSTTLLTFIYSVYCMVYPLVDNEMINEFSTVGLSILILWIGSVLIKRYSYTLLLGTQFDSVEGDIRSMISSLDCYKANYTTKDVKVSRVNHKVWIIIIEMEMLGANDEEEAKVRFYVNRVVNGVMSRAVNTEIVQTSSDDNKNQRGDLLDLITTTDGYTPSSSQFEITVDCKRR